MALRSMSPGDGIATDSAIKTEKRRPPNGPVPVASALPAIPLRASSITVKELVALYMAHYAGRDTTRPRRLAWWQVKIGQVTLGEVTDDHVHAALEDLALEAPRYFAGQDADGKPILKAKRRTLSGATVNRYAAGLAAVFTWSIRRRIAPKGWVHPCRSIERKPESSGKTRYLSPDERVRLLTACKASSWNRLYLLVLTAVTTGARKGELLGMRWADIDFQHAIAHVGRSKNGDPKTLPLIPAVIDELRRFEVADDRFVFPSYRRPLQPYNFESRWQEAMRAAKIHKFRFHDLRHSCASMLAQNGATLLEIADLLGHRQLQMTKRYSHLTNGHKSALVNRVMGSVQ